MLERAIAAGVPCAWVTADSVYGGDYALRLWLERQPIGYVLAVTSKQRAPLGFDTVKERTAACVAATDWHRLSAGDGAKGPRLYDGAYQSYPSLQAGWSRGLLVRRSIAEPDKLTYYLTFAPEGTPLAPRWCGSRARAGRWSRVSKPPRARLGSTSTRCAPGRRGTATSRWRCSPWPFSPSPERRLSGGEERVDLSAELLPLTVPEIRRLLASWIGLPPPEPTTAIAWSIWRRRHQQRARQCHWRRRTQTGKSPL